MAKVRQPGRPRVVVPKFEEAYERYMRRELTQTKLAEELGISRPTLSRLIREHRRENKKY